MLGVFIGKGRACTFRRWVRRRVYDGSGPVQATDTSRVPKTIVETYREKVTDYVPNFAEAGFVDQEDFYRSIWISILVLRLASEVFRQRWCR